MASILGNEWHISSSGNEFLTESGSIQDKQQLYNFALNTDLKEICSPVLNGLSNDLTSKVVLQIHKIRNISAPKANEESQAAPRMLKLTLTDGENYIQAIELSTIGTISLKNTPPGTKVLIQGAKLSSGFLLLNSQNCKVLGGKVASLIEKWEFTKNVQRNRRNYNEDGPPPWVNFGVKIQTGNQGDNLKSLTNKPKDMPKENSEFEQQRQDAIAEASSGAVKKIFSGRVKQNVQVQNATNRRNPEKSKEKKEPIKGKGKPIKEKGEIDDKPQKPSEKVSLFDFLEDKLPVTSKEDTFYNNQPYRSNFKDTESSVEDQNKYDYKRKKMPIPKQFEKPETKRGQNSIKQNDNNVKQNFTDIQSNKIDNSHQHRQNANIGSSFTKQRQSNFNSNSANFSTNNQYQNQQINRMPLQGNSFHSLPPNYQVNAFQFNQPPPVNNPSSAVNNFQYNQQPIQNQNLNFNSNNFQYNQQIQNSNNFNKRPYQKQNVQNDVNHITRETQKMTLNSQFASRSLRQHLNLGAPSPRRNDEIPRKVEDNGPCWNIGDEVLAKYWEDGKFYNATIISITDKTFAVRFKGYGNIEEILKTDCLPIMQNSYRPNNNPNQQYDKNNKQYSGSVEFRRSSKNYK